MENTWTAENAVREKSALQRPSSKQLEARITAYTVILAAIIVNILWWAGSQSVEWESNSNITQENILRTFLLSNKNLCDTARLFLTLGCLAVSFISCPNRPGNLMKNFFAICKKVIQSMFFRGSE